MDSHSVGFEKVRRELRQFTVNNLELCRSLAKRRRHNDGVRGVEKRV